MLRLLAFVAGLALLALLIVVSLRNGTHERLPAPDPIPAVRETHSAHEPLPALDSRRRNEAGDPIAPDAHYVGIVGELTREEDGSLVDGGVVTFGYRYLSKDPNANLREVEVDVDEHGHFEQLFSEPVRLVTYRIRPAELHLAGSADKEGPERGDFLRLTGKTDLSVTAAGTTLALRVPCGLEVHGQVFEATTHAPLPRALVWADVGIGHCVAAITDQGGWYSIFGIDPRLALSSPINEKDNWAVDGPRERYVVTLRAHLSGYADGSVAVPLPLRGRRSGPFDFQLVPGLEVSGTALDCDGKPAAGARLFLTTWDGAHSNASAESQRSYVARAADNGLFSFEGVLPADGGEIRIAHPTQDGPEPTLALGALHAPRTGVEVRLVETQVVRVRARAPDGAFLDSQSLKVLVHDAWGERSVEWSGPVLAIRVRIAVGMSSDLEVRCNFDSTGKPVTLHARTTIQPLEKHDEPETVTLDLVP